MVDLFLARDPDGLKVRKRNILVANNRRRWQRSHCSTQLLTIMMTPRWDEMHSRDGEQGTTGEATGGHKLSGSFRFFGNRYIFGTG